MPEVVQSLQQ